MRKPGQLAFPSITIFPWPTTDNHKQISMSNIITPYYAIVIADNIIREYIDQLAR